MRPRFNREKIPAGVFRAPAKAIQRPHIHQCWQGISPCLIEAVASEEKVVFRSRREGVITNSFSRNRVERWSSRKMIMKFLLVV
jgi:hypothetical protein